MLLRLVSWYLCYMERINKIKKDEKVIFDSFDAVGVTYGGNGLQRR